MFNGIILGCLIMLAIAMLGVLGGPSSAPQTAEAFSTRSNTTQICQAVIDRLGVVQQIVGDEVASGKLKPLAALDECVAQERRIDNSKCPEDFRIAEMRFVSAEDSLLRHAKMDPGNRTDLALAAVFDIVAHKSRFNYANWVSDEMKQDLDDIQSARRDLIQIALNYGVK
jgi:hypothetical protein